MNHTQAHEVIVRAMQIIEQDPYGSIAPLLPAFFMLKNKPYDLSWSHFLMEPMFRFKNVPRKMIWKTARQVSKSTSLAASQLIRAAIVPDYVILTVMPLFEQVRKFSQNVVKPFIYESPIKHIFIDPYGSESVLQRNLPNRSILYYSYSCGDPNRVRGISASEVCFDEVQDLDFADLPIIEACMSASPYKITRYTGTPKTFDNTIQLLWRDSSQGIWHIPCQATGCKHLNRCSTDGDLLHMLGEHTLVCAKCGQPVNSRLGFYVHDYPDRRATFAGYHVSQPILPMHYESPRDWALIKEAERTKPTYVFFNEILGEAYDIGAKLLTEEDIKAAAVAPAVDLSNNRDIDIWLKNNYVMTVVGVDWGGRGKEKAADSEEFVSNTAIAVASIASDASIDIIWLHRIPYTVNAAFESDIVLQTCAAVRPDYVAIDYGGQGSVQEQLLVGKGLPPGRIVPFTYAVMSPNRPIVLYHKPNYDGVRSSYTLDKPRSLLLLCEMIKRKMIRLPKSDLYLQNHLREFLNIYEESIDTPRGSPRRLVKKMARTHDDIVHAINFAVMGLLHATQLWPDIAKMFVQQESG